MKRRREHDCASLDCCPSEVPLIHAILDGQPGVRAVKVIVPTQTVVVEHASTTASVSSIVDTLNAAGLDASLAPTPKASREQDFASYGATLRDSPPPFSVLASCILLAVSLLHSVGGALDQLKWVALGAVVIGLPPSCTEPFESSYWRDRHQHAHDARRGVLAHFKSSERRGQL